MCVREILCGREWVCHVDTGYQLDRILKVRRVLWASLISVKLNLTPAFSFLINYISVYFSKEVKKQKKRINRTWNQWPIWEEHVREETLSWTLALSGCQKRKSLCTVPRAATALPTMLVTIVMLCAHWLCRCWLGCQAARRQRLGHTSLCPKWGCVYVCWPTCLHNEFALADRNRSWCAT